MKIQAGDTVLITGATGGLGLPITMAFAKLKVKLVLVAYPGIGLDDLQKDIERLGCRSMAVTCDVRDAEQRKKLLQEVQHEFGGVDVLINNAGVEFTSAYHDLSEDNIKTMLGVNLEGPMIFSRLVLPEMLNKRRGHIVNISSLAGKSGPAFQEPYAATKAGLIAFTASLRSTYRKSGVSASAIVPGFVEAGIYSKLKSKSGCAAPSLLGTSSPQKIPAAVIKSIEKDLPEIIINPLPVRPLLALSALCPRVGEWFINKTGANDFFKKVVESQKRN